MSCRQLAPRNAKGSRHHRTLREYDSGDESEPAGWPSPISEAEVLEVAFSPSQPSGPILPFFKGPSGPPLAVTPATVVPTDIRPTWLVGGGGGMGGGSGVVWWPACQAVTVASYDQYQLGRR